MQREHTPDPDDDPQLRTTRVLSAVTAVILMGSLARLVLLVGRQAALGLATLLLFGAVFGAYLVVARSAEKARRGTGPAGPATEPKPRRDDA